MFPNRRYRKRPSGPDRSAWTPAQKAEAEKADRLATPVAEMALPVRVVNTLENYGVITASDLLAQTYASLMAMQNLGETTLAEIKTAVKALGLKPPNWKKPPKPPRRRGGTDPLRPR